jgi:hypothetical protein
MKVKSFRGRSRRYIHGGRDGWPTRESHSKTGSYVMSRDLGLADITRQRRKKEREKRRCLALV